MPVHVQLAPALGGSGNPPEAGAPIRVVLADNHAAMRRSLRLLLDGEEDLQVVAEAERVSTVMRAVHHHQPRVLVLDLGMHNGSSIKAIRRLRQEVPGSEIVVLTMKESPAFARRAIDAGAVGYVLKDRADSELADAIRSAAHGKEYVSVQVSAGLDSLRQSVRNDGLTLRAAEVLRLTALGHTTTEIAGNLGLSRRAVETRRTRIRQRLGLQTSAALFRYELDAT